MGAALQIEHRRAMTKTDWWIGHTRATIRYTIAVNEADIEIALKEAAHLTRAVFEWSRIVKDKTGDEVRGLEAAAFMAEHTIAAKLLADSLKARRGSEVSVAQGLLSRNLDAQAELIKMFVSEFPEKEFRALFEEHVRLLISYMRQAARLDLERFKETIKLAEENAEDLDRFTSKELF